MPTTANDHFDAVVRITPTDELDQTAFGTIKKTYDIRDGRLVLAAPEPLQHDLLDESLEPRWPPGSDYWPFKTATDVAVLGNAYGPGGRSVERRSVSVRVGDFRKRVEVFGKRLVEWEDSGRPRLGLPEQFTEMPLDYRHGYGGIDDRVIPKEAQTLDNLIDLMGTNDGMYPRNQSGKGYLVLAEPRDGVELPNLEDPDHLLVADALVADPARWYRQPLSWFLGWQYPAMFPRAYYFGAGLHRSVPEDVLLEEVRRGLMPEAWRQRSGSPLSGYPPAPHFYQEASLGMSFLNVAEGMPIECNGMHPDRETLGFTLPKAPTLEIEIDGDRTAVEAKLLHVVVTPHEEKVELTWAGIRRDLPRAYFPGVHAEIPLSFSVDGTVVRYDTPEPIYTRIKQAEAAGVRSKAPPARKPGEPGYLEVMGALLPEAPAERTRDQTPPFAAPTFNDLDVATGRLLLEATDWRLPGSASFAFRRFYSSGMTWRAGTLGLGWSHSLEQAVWEQGGWVLYQTEDGREVGIPIPGGGHELGLGQRAHQPVAGVTILRVASDAFEVRLDDGRRFGFTQVAQALQTGPVKARLARIWGAGDTPLDVRYDTYGRLDRLMLPDGRFARFEHDARGRLVRVFQPTRNGADEVIAARYEVDVSGQLVEAADGAGRTSKYRYQAHLLVQETNPEGRVRRFTYDGTGTKARVTSQTSGENRRELSFDPERGSAGIGDALGGSFSASVDAHHRLTGVTDRFVHRLTRTYDEHTGMLASQSTPDGETTYLYDAYFHLADLSAPDEGSVALEHDELAHLTGLTDPDGHASRWGWDELGRLRAHTDAAGASVLFEYQGEGPLRAMTTPSESRVELERNESQAVVRVSHPTGARTARRDALGRLTECTDELGQLHSLRYDPSGRVAQRGYPEEHARVYESDAEGRVTRVHDGQRDVTLERTDGWVTAVRRNGVGMATHRDAEGHVSMVESESFDFWELHRDAAGRLQEEAGFTDDEDFRFLRDHRGQVIRQAAGQVRTTVARDRAGRPTELEHSDETFQRFTWSPGGRLTQAQAADRVVTFERDGRGRPTLETRQDGHWVKSGYNTRGRELVQSSLGLGVRIERDALGQPISVVAQSGEQRLELIFERDAAGRETRRHLPGGLSLKWTRDGLGRPTARAVMFNERTLATLTFGWSGLDRLVSVEDPQRGTRAHRYDSRGRLIQVGGAVRVLDDVGRVFRSEARDDHTYVAGGRLNETYGIEYRYDSIGRRTEKETPDGTVLGYRWNGAGRLREVVLSEDRRIAYLYDALGRMVERRLENRTVIEGLDEPVWEAERTTWFYWDGLNLLHEVDGSAITSWLWDGPTLLGKIDDSGVYAALLDASGMPTELVDQKGNLAWRGNVDLYGMLETEAEETSCPWRFPGHWEDPDTGLLHTWLRVYDPEVGAYLTPNPLGIVAGSNLYAYVDDPMTQSSPLGLGMGYETLLGALRCERLEGEMIPRLLEALDRGDGAAGPLNRYDADAAKPTLPDPEAVLYGPWAQYRVHRHAPPAASSFFRLPSWTGLGKKNPR